MILEISTLKVTQGTLRLPMEELWQMVRFVKEGGFWTIDQLNKYHSLKNQSLCKKRCLIQIHELDDGERFLHDGHHRMAATWFAGREYLREDEFEVEKWPYSDSFTKTGYIDLNHENYWYTPFDPRTHLRISDTREFKTEARKRFEENPSEAQSWIEKNAHRFRMPITNVRTVSDLAKIVFANEKLT